MTPKYLSLDADGTVRIQVETDAVTLHHTTRDGEEFRVRIPGNL
jgi:hypothetical protein